jgi:acyl carrier protein
VREGVAVRGATVGREELLAKCGEIVGVDNLRPDDDFFGVGADSLDAVEICAMLRREVGQEVTVNQVTGSPTFGDLLSSLVGERA